MASRFPGIDPFIEQQRWQDFHTVFNTYLREYLLERVGEKYYVNLETRVYSESWPGPDLEIIPDASLHVENPGAATAVAPQTTTAAAPVDCLVPLPAKQRERYLTITRISTKNVVTVIETLSPFNKQPGRRGYGRYQRKRGAILSSATHLVEFDFLRGGRRMPIEGVQLNGSFYALVSRSYRRPHASVYLWGLRDQLPPIRIPLLEEDPDLVIALSDVYEHAHSSGQYTRILDYSQPLSPALEASDEKWLRMQIVG